MLIHGCQHSHDRSIPRAIECNAFRRVGAVLGICALLVVGTVSCGGSSKTPDAGQSITTDTAGQGSRAGQPALPTTVPAKDGSLLWYFPVGLETYTINGDKLTIAARSGYFDDYEPRSLEPAEGLSNDASESDSTTLASLSLATGEVVGKPIKVPDGGGTLNDHNRFVPVESTSKVAGVTYEETQGAGLQEASASAVLHVWDTSSGRELWHNALPNDRDTSTFCVGGNCDGGGDDDAIVSATATRVLLRGTIKGEHALSAYDMSNGRNIWQRPVEQVNGGLSEDERYLITQPTFDTMAVTDTNTGKLLDLPAELGGSIDGVAFVAGDVFYAEVGDTVPHTTATYAVDDNGAVKKVANGAGLGGANIIHGTTMVSADGKVLVHSEDNGMGTATRVSATDLDSGKVLWSIQPERVLGLQRIVGDQAVFTAVESTTNTNTPRQVVALDIKTGKQIGYKNAYIGPDNAARSVGDTVGGDPMTYANDAFAWTGMYAVAGLEGGKGDYGGIFCFKSDTVPVGIQYDESGSHMPLLVTVM